MGLTKSFNQYYRENLSSIVSIHSIPFVTFKPYIRDAYKAGWNDYKKQLREQLLLAKDDKEVRAIISKIVQ